MQGRIRQILDLLKGEYGIPEWQPRSDPVSVLVQTILSQNTSDTNSRGAFQSLLASFDNWGKVVDAVKWSSILIVVSILPVFSVILPL